MQRVIPSESQGTKLDKHNTDPLAPVQRNTQKLSMQPTYKPYFYTMNREP